MAGMGTRNFNNIVNSGKKKMSGKKKSKNKAIQSIFSAFDFRDRPEPKEEPIKRPKMAKRSRG